MRGSSKVRTVISGTAHSACISPSSRCRIQEAEGQSRRVGSEQATRKVTRMEGERHVRIGQHQVRGGQAGSAEGGRGGKTVGSRVREGNGDSRDMPRKPRWGPRE